MYFCRSFIKMSSLNISPFSKGDIILKSFILGPLNVCIIVNVDVKAMGPDTGEGTRALRRQPASRWPGN